MNRSIRLASLAGRYFATSNPFTSPAIWDASADASKCVIRVMPDSPARIFAQAVCNPIPTGDTMPRPVTTTLRRDTVVAVAWLAADREMRLAARVRLDVVDRLLDGRDLLGLLVRDFGFEFFLQGHYEFDGVERVGAEIVDEGRFVLDVSLVHAELLGHDLLHALFDVLHRFPPSMRSAAMPACTRRSAPPGVK